MLPNLRGRVAVVTGSTSGIGAEIARALHAEGVQLVLNSRSSSEAGARLAADLFPAVYHQADVSDRDQAQSLVDRAVEEWGSIDFLVNSAGATEPIAHDNLDAATADVWFSMLSSNVIGAWHMIQAAVPRMRESDRASIVNISSMAGIQAMGSSIPYAACKAALNHMTVLAAKALGPSVRVNAVAPGLIDTPWTKDFDLARIEVAARAPKRRIGNPTDVSDACLFLLHQDYVTGVIIPVDGGMRLV